MFSLFTGKYGGYVKAVGLSKFWDRLTTEERNFSTEAICKSLYPEKVLAEQVSGKGIKIHTDWSASDFLTRIASRALAKKHFVLAEKTLIEASKKEKDAQKRHAILTDLIDVYYKQRTEREDALDKCMHYCKIDMALAPHIVPNSTAIPSFKRLAIILEQQGKYEEAIAIAEHALQLGLTDGTRGGFEGRIEKLKTKIL